jgi:NADH-quinone oxidoreductase subunit L
MTVPLLVLAAASTLAGFLNVEPEVPIVSLFDFGQGAALHEWLHPVTATAEAIAAGVPGVAEPHHLLWPIALAILLAVGGLVAAVLLLKPDRLRTADEEPAYTDDLGRLLYNKWYVDEFYQKVVVRPVYALSDFFSRVVDRGLIDGIVDGSARLAQGIGLLAGRAQTGQLNTYAFVILVGVLAVLGAFVAL